MDSLIGIDDEEILGSDLTHGGVARRASIRLLNPKFMGERDPQNARIHLDPVPHANEKQKQVEQLIHDDNFKCHDLPSVSTMKMMHFTRGLLVEPVSIPWEMTVPVPVPNELQRTLKPSIRTNIGLFRDHLAHAQQMYWPRQANRRPIRKGDSYREILK